MIFGEEGGARMALPARKPRDRRSAYANSPLSSFGNSPVSPAASRMKKRFKPGSLVKITAGDKKKMP